MLTSSLLRTLPGSAYTDPVVFAAEQERIFEPSWTCVAAASDLAAPGAFRTVTVGRESVIVVRGRDGALRAFLNVCRHRGSQLCSEPAGQLRRNLQCGYHAWTYDLTGKLVAAPNLTSMPDVDRVEYSLLPVHLREWIGQVWLCLGDSPPSFEDEVQGAIVERLGDLATIDAWGIPDLALGRRITYDVAANWKLIVENFMECYHCATIHPELTEVLPEFADGLRRAVLRRPRRGVRRAGGRVHRGRAGGLRPPPRRVRRPRPPLLRDHHPAAGVHQPGARPRDPPPHDPARRRPHGRGVRLAVRPRHRGRTSTPPSSSSTASTSRTSTACERTQPAMSSRAYRDGGVLVPSEHHIGQFHEWVSARLDR